MKTTARRRFLVWCAMTLLLGPMGCAPNRLAHSPSPSQLASATTGTIGVVPGRFPPEIKLVTVTQSRALGAARGAGLGFVTGAGTALGATAGMPYGCSGWVCGAALLVEAALVFVGGTVGAVMGGVTGAMEPIPLKSIGPVEGDARTALADLGLQDAMATRVLRELQQRPPKQFLLLPDDGPRTIDEDTDYRALESQGVGAVLEVAVRELGFESGEGEDPPLRLFLTLRARLIRTTDGSTLYASTLDHRSESLRRAAWEADGFKPLRTAIDEAGRSFAERIANALFPVTED